MSLDILFYKDGEKSPYNDGCIWSVKHNDWIIPDLEKKKKESMAKAHHIVHKVCYDCEHYSVSDSTCKISGDKINVEDVNYRIVDGRSCPDARW